MLTVSHVVSALGFPDYRWTETCTDLTSRAQEVLRHVLRSSLTEVVVASLGRSWSCPTTAGI